jgi:hypothetical protein
LDTTHAYNIAGAIAFESSTTAPAAGLVFKTSDTTRRYITCYRTNGSSVILPFRKVGNKYIYARQETPAASALIALSAGAATSLTDVSLASWMPPHSRIALVEAKFNPVRGSFDTCELRGKSAGTGENYLMQFEGVNGVGQPSDDAFYKDFELVTDSSQVIQYKVNSSDSRLRLYANGFIE